MRLRIAQAKSPQILLNIDQNLHPDPSTLLFSEIGLNSHSDLVTGNRVLLYLQ
jgi:hypothetical protein